MENNIKYIEVSDPQEVVTKSLKERILFMSGVGSGKSHVLGLISAEYAINFPETRGFIGANSYTQLSKSTLDRIFKVWGTLFGWHFGQNYVVDRIPPPSFKTYGERLKSYDNTICFDNGHLIFTASLEKYKLIDGTEFSYALLDETKDTREEAVKDVIVARLREKGIWIVNDMLYDRVTVESKLKRGIWKQVDIENKPCIFDLATMNEVKGFNPLYVSTSPAKVAWLNEWFDIDKYYPLIKQKIYSKTDFYKHEIDNKCVVISSTYHNEKNLPPDYIANLFKDYTGSENKANMLIYGDPIGKTGGEWWTSFDRLKHVKPLAAEADLPFHITFDFNVVPYMTMLVIQIKVKEVEGKRVLEVRFLKEYCLENPNNKVAACCRAFIKDFGHFNSPVYYYGDKSGKNRQTLSEDYEHHYKVVEDILRKYMTNDSDRVVPNNPSLTKSRDFCNKILAGGFDWVEVYYSDQMKKTTLDKEVLKEDVTGGYKPAKIPHPETKIPYEPYGHCFVGETKILTKTGEKRIDEIKVGDYVLTRKGYNKVVRKFNNGLKEVYKYNLCNSHLICTPTHSVWTESSGFKPVNLIHKDIFTIFDFQKQKICQEKSFITKALNFQETPNLKTERSGFISLVMSEKKERDYTDINTNVKKEKLKKVFIFTTKTATLLTMILITLRKCLHWFTLKLTTKNFLRSINRQEKTTYLQKQYPRLRHGIAQSPGESGIDNTLKTRLKKIEKKLFAKNVEAKPFCQMLNIAPTNAVAGLRLGGIERRENMTRKESVSIAIKNLAYINGQRHFVAQNNVGLTYANVYNFEVENEHEYFANGILVKNCSDAERYFWCGAFADAYNEMNN